jgi:hypothetical protein
MPQCSKVGADTESLNRVHYGNILMDNWHRICNVRNDMVQFLVICVTVSYLGPYLRTEPKVATNDDLGHKLRRPCLPNSIVKTCTVGVNVTSIVAKL